MNVCHNAEMKLLILVRIWFMMSRSGVIAWCVNQAYTDKAFVHQTCSIWKASCWHAAFAYQSFKMVQPKFPRQLFLNRWCLPASQGLTCLCLINTTVNVCFFCLFVCFSVYLLFVCFPSHACLLLLSNILKWHPKPAALCKIWGKSFQPQFLSQGEKHFRQLHRTLWFCLSLINFSHCVHWTNPKH